jgi:hypothetical protein
MLAWGIPLVIVGLVLGGVARYLREQSEYFRVLGALTFQTCLVPVAMCLLGMVQLRMARHARLRWALAIAGVMCIGLFLGIVFGTSRPIFGKTAGGSIVSWDIAVSIATIAIAFACLSVGGAAGLVGQDLWALGREFRLRFRGWIAISVGMVWISVLAPVVVDCWAFFTYAGPQFTPGPGQMPAGQVHGYPTTNVRVDTLARTAALFGTLGVWGAVMLVRARLSHEMCHTTGRTSA